MDRTYVSATKLKDILLIEFNSPVLSKQVFRQLNDILDTVDDNIAGVIFTSSLDSKIFLAGADLYDLDFLI